MTTNKRRPRGTQQHLFSIACARSVVAKIDGREVVGDVVSLTDDGKVEIRAWGSGALLTAPASRCEPIPTNAATVGLLRSLDEAHRLQGRRRP